MSRQKELQALGPVEGVPSLKLHKLENPPIDHTHLVNPMNSIKSEIEFEDVSNYLKSELSKEVPLTNMDISSLGKDSQTKTISSFNITPQYDSESKDED